ncbi:exendin-4-like [Pogona vitticeps]|nr:exendin-4-like [Pogona vitticeps]
MNKITWLCVFGLVIAATLPTSWQMAIESRLVSEEENGAEHFLAKAKRHNEGTYGSDYTELMDREKAREFVQWLINQGATVPPGLV